MGLTIQPRSRNSPTYLTGDVVDLLPAQSSHQTPVVRRSLQISDGLSFGLVDRIYLTLECG
jgi:hypothetical protein